VLEMTAKRGITTVLDNEGKLVGVITDGDLRRLLEKTEDLFSLKVREVMTRNPKVISRSEPVRRAFQLMRDYGITALIVVNGARVPTGIVHLHDLMRAGVV
jgi:arabinose-5-phosphate isomerase